MALKKKKVEHVLVRSVDTKAVVSVSTGTAEQLLRNKGEYELVKSSTTTASDTVEADAEAKAAAKAAKKAGKKASAEKSEGATPAVPASTVAKPEWPKGSLDDWTAYAKSVGVNVDGLDRNAIHSAVAALEADNK